jgi:TPR repeat protein
MTEVGYVYPKSWKQAAEWYERAGAHGSYRGYSSLGLIAFNGHLGERNINEAIRYFNLAAKLGSHEDSLRARALTANPNIRNTDQLADAGARIEVADNPPATNTNTRQANGLRYVCGFPKSVSTNGCVWR